MHPSHMPLGLRESAKAIPSRPITRFTIHMASGKSKIRVRAKAQSLKPYEELEIIYNGKVVRSVRPSGDHFEAVIDEAVEVDRGGWIAARAHGRKMLEYGATWWKMPVFAHSSPIYLDMPGRPAAAQESARLFLESTGSSAKLDGGESAFSFTGEQIRGSRAGGASSRNL